MIDNAAYMAHGYCLLWKPWLVALHAGSDFLIFAAYFAIPVAIWIFVSKRPNVEMRGLARLFAAFILWCGLTHIINLVTLWWPIYEFQGVVKAITAGISVTTAVMIFPLIPKALAIPSPNELQLANAELASEIAAHKRTLRELQQARAKLEQRVEARTKELSEATERFRSLFEHAPVAMLMADKDGSLRLANTGAERLFDYAKDELIGQSVDMLLPEAHRQEHQALRAAFHDDPAARPMGLGRDLHGRRKDGQEIPVEIGLNPLRVDGETFVVASIVDISARRLAEQRMQFVHARAHASLQEPAGRRAGDCAQDSGIRPRHGDLPSQLRRAPGRSCQVSRPSRCGQLGGRADPRSGALAARLAGRNGRQPNCHRRPIDHARARGHAVPGARPA